MTPSERLDTLVKWLLSKNTPGRLNMKSYTTCRLHHAAQCPALQKEGLAQLPGYEAIFICESLLEDFFGLTKGEMIEVFGYDTKGTKKQLRQWYTTYRSTRKEKT